MCIQLEFFSDTSDHLTLKKEIDSVKESTDKVRKSLFARHAELAKKYCELQSRLSILERNICKGEYGNDEFS